MKNRIKKIEQMFTEYDISHKDYDISVVDKKTLSVKYYYDNFDMLESKLRELLSDIKTTRVTLNDVCDEVIIIFNN